MVDEPPPPARRRGRWIGAGAAVALLAVGAWRLGASHAGAGPSSTSARALATTSSSTAPTSSTTSTSAAPATVTLSAVGDTELGNTPNLAPKPASYFDPVRSALAAPIVFGNLEGTFTGARTSKCTPTSTECYAFRVPVRFARVYRDAGFTVLNSANNHSWDFGARGVKSTSAAMKGAGITQAGLPGQIGVVREGTLRVAFVDFAPYYNTNNLLDVSAAAALIRRAHTEADLVVVYMHAGAEGPQADHVTRRVETFVGENRGNPYAFAHAAIDAGADLVIGSGPHVLRGMQWYRGHLIAYSLGDFTNYFDFSSSGDLALSGILHVTLSADGQFVAGHFTSVLLAPDGQASVDPRDGAARFVNALSRDDFGSSAALIGANGSIAAP